MCLNRSVRLMLIGNLSLTRNLADETLIFPPPGPWLP
jgi:hypothetical protein